MSSDDEWDASDDDWETAEVDFEARAKEAQKKKRANSEDSSSEEEEVEEVKPAPTQPVKQQPASHRKGEIIIPKELQVPCKDPEKEKLRLRKIQELTDLQMAAELVGGEHNFDMSAFTSAPAAEKSGPAKLNVITKDVFEEWTLERTEDIEKLSAQILEKLKEAKAKGAATKIFVESFKQMESALSLQELDEMEKMIAEIVRQKKVDKTETEASKRKQNEKLSKTTKFNAQDELDVVYGDGDWEEWEDWEEYA